tara:strand:+ start:592 stop:1038 length:447 start_codon:yes stop_codon:yes gene_type:complete
MFINLFRKGPIPEELPKSMQKVVDSLKKTKSKEECLTKAYEVISKRFHGCRLLTHLKAYLTRDLEKMWNVEKTSHCTNLNYLFYVLLIKSGKFKKEDFKLRWSLVFSIAPHQYFEIKMSKEGVVYADPFGGTYGMKLGNYYHGWYLLK